MRTSSWRLMLCAALATGVAGGFALPAQAANIAPNPDFANCTGGVPDGWSASATAGSRIACVSDGNGDATGVRLDDVTDTVFIETMVSACIPTGSIAAGPTAASFAYKSQIILPGLGFAQVVPSSSLTATFFSSTDCSGTALATPDNNVDNSAPGSRPWNTWLTESGTITVPTGTASMTLSFSYSVGVGQTGIGDLFVDDIVFDATTSTAVTFRSLSAARGANGVTVRWRTASEIGTLGFHVYREVNGKRVRANAKLVAAKGRGSYSFLDRRAPRGKAVRYWIQEVALDGTRSWHGPAAVGRR